MLNADYSAPLPETLQVSAESGPVTVPDAHLLFNAQYSRTAHDLILTDADGSRLVISGYFDRPELPSLVSPEGAMLRPEVITALAGPLAPGQYAQAGGAGGGEAIGKVTALTGTVTAQHADGTVVQLQVGDAVFKGDVLQSGPQSSIGVVFTDDTVFSLSANARMVLNEMVYQPGGSDNSMTFSLVEGSFSFIAGKVAPTGEMKFNTPVASMGIRGTCGGAGTSANGNTQFVLCEDPDGKVGAYVLTNLITGELLATVNTTSFAFVLSTPTGQVINVPRSEADQISDETIQTIYQVYDNAVKGGDIQGSNEKGSTSVGENSPPTPEQVLTVGETAFSAGGDKPLGGSALQDMKDLGTENLDGDDGDANEPDGDSTSTDSADGSNAQTAAGSAEPEPIIVSEPNTTPDTDTEPDTPSTIPPVTDTATEGGSSSTLDPLANAPAGATVTAVPSTLPAGVTFDDSNPAAPSFTLDPTDPAYDSLAAGQPQIVTVNYQIVSGSTTTPASVQWTVTGENDAPLATDDSSLSTNENTSLNNINVLGNDDDIDGDPLVISGTPTALHGTVTVNPDGTLNYTPNAGHTGSDTITYTVTDGTLTDTGEVSITVTAVNDAPVAVDDGPLTTNEDTALNNINVLGNDTDVDGPALSISGTPTALHGTVTVNPDGTLNYTPATNYNGSDTITYTVTDGTLTDTGEVSITVTAVNDAPVAVDDGPLTTNEDTALNNINVLGNDTDVDGPALSISGTPTALHGTVTVNPDGTLNYMPNAGYTGSDTITYVVTDGDVSDTGDVAITVTAVNDAPVAVDDGPFTTSEDTTLNNINVLGNDTDTDGPALSISGTPTALHGTVTINPDGTLNYTPAANYNGSDTITYIVTDGTSTDTGQVSITVTAVNDAPVAVDDGPLSTNEDTALNNINVLGNDTDVDGPALSISGTPTALHGTVTVNPDGTLNYTPAANYNGSDTITYVVTDGSLTDTGQVAITVTAVNDAPVAVDDGPFTTNEDTALNNINVLGNDTDVDGPALAISGTPTALHGTVTVNPDGTLNYTPAANYNGSDTITYTVTDGTSTDTGQVAITVTAINDAPVAVDDGPLTTNEDIPLNNINVLGNDTDVDGPALSISGTPTALHGTVTVNPDGTLNYTPAANYNGSDTITYVVTDGSLTDTGQVAITVTAVNDAPVAVDDGPFTTNEDTALNNINVLGNDTDVDGPALSISGTPTALHGTVTVNPDGTLNYTPAANYNGSDTITYTVTDGSLTDTGQVAITVTAINDAPVAVDDGPLTTNEDIPLNNINVLGNDTDVDGPALSISGTPTALHGTVTVNPDGTLNYTPAANYNGSDTITYVVTDGTSTDTGQVAITVTAVNDAPVAVDDGPFTTNEDTALNNINVLGNDTDVDGPALSVSGTPTALHGTVTVNPDGTLNYTPNAAFNGADTITYVVTDGTLTDTGQVAINVTALNDAPVAVDDGPFTTNEDTALNNINVLGNDTDVDGPALSISGTPTALYGTVTVNPDGTLNYTPFTNYNGPDTITYTVTDGTSTDTGEVSISVTPVPDPPVAVDDGPFSTDEDTPLNNIDVLFNDFDVDGQFVSISGTPTALHGTVTVNPDGTLNYTPNANYSGADTITYEVTDETSTDTAQVAITVNPVNDAPVAVDDGPFTTNEGTTLSNINVLGNDTDADGDTLSISGKPTALHLTAPNTALPSNLIARWTADGTIEDAVGNNDGVLQNGASFTSGNFGQAFHFDGVNDSVAAPATGLPVGNSDRTISLWMKADTFGSGETFLAGYGTFGSSGQTYHLGTTGDVLFFSQWGGAVLGPSLEAGQWYHVAVTNVGNSVTLYVDGVAVATGTVSINTPAGTDFLIGARPTISIPGLLQGDVDDIQVYDRALTAQEIESVYNAGAATAEHGTVTVNPDGTLNYTPDPGFSGTDTITYVVTDGTSTDTGEVTITVNAVNDAPVAVDDGPFETDEDTPLSNIDVLGNDTDVDGPALLIFGTPTALHGTVTVNPDGTLNYTPDADYNGPDTITYEVTDGTDTDTGEVAITVNAVNDAPAITNLDASTTSLEGVPSVVDPNVAISDAELDAFNYDGSTLTVARTSSPDPEDSFSFGSSTNFSVDGSTLKDNGGNVIANFSTAGNSLVISFTAFATAALVDDVAQHIAYANTSDTPPASIVLDYTFSDGELSDTESITVDITAVNDGPFAAPDNIITNIAPGNPVDIPEQAVLANDFDPDGGGPLDVNAAGGETGGTVTHSPGSGATGTLTFTGSTPAGGTFVYTATDGSASGAFGIATVSFDMDGALEGTSDANILIGANGGTMLIGHGGDDQLVGGIGRDIYVWSANDGYDTILPNGTGANEDIIKVRGSFYDYNWEVSGDDLIVGVVADDTYQWPGGNLTIKDFLNGGDSVEYLTADLGDNNGFYSPGGGDARIYLSAVTGTDQGNYFETIIGTNDGETMEGNGGAIDWFNARGGNDTMSVSNGTQGFFRAGDGDDIMTGADEDDQFIGGDGEDTIFGNGGMDEVRYDRSAGSLEPMPDGVGVTVNVGTDITLSTGGSQIEGGEAVDNWGRTDHLTDVENVRGSDFDDTIVGSAADNQLRGLRGDDMLVGRAGADLYRWSFNDGYDTILADEGAPDEDIIRLDGGFYDIHWELDGNDLVVGAAVDDTPEWIEVGGNLRLKDFVLPGGDTIAYIRADLTLENNEFYSPGNGDNEARLYLSAINGNDQGSFTELIIGTDAGETMTGGGGAADRLMGGGGNDIMSVDLATRGHFTGGDGDDHMTGGDENDVFRGGDGADTIIGGAGSDEVRYDGRADSTALPTQGVTVNLGSTITIAGVNGGSPIAGTTAIDNWGKTDTLSSIERVRGSTMSDLLVGSNGSNRIQGMGGDDTLVGRGGADTYVWGANDGYDTIISTGGAANEDVIQITGSVYDLDWGRDGNDLLVGAAIDDTPDWAEVGGNLRIKNFFTGSDTINYLTGNLGANNEFYSPSGTEDARIYLSAVNGGNQGNYFEAIVGTAAGEIMFGGGGAIDHLSGGGGNDTMSVDANTFGIFRGGDGDDDMTGGDLEDNFVGGAGNDTITGGNGVDEVRYDRPGGSDEGGMTQGVVVNLGTTITIDIDGVPTEFQGFTAQDNWGDQDTFTTTNIGDPYADTEDVRGSALADDLVGSDLGNQIRGMAGDDLLVGRGGGDTYVWSFNDGYDTILADEGAANEDVIRLNGSFYDFNWEGAPDNPNDLLVGGAVNDVYDWNDVGGNLRIKDFFLPGGDTIAYIEGDFGPNNHYFNPDGSGDPTQIYLNAVTGEDQGNHSELILGTYGDDIMEGNGGAFDIFYGDDGNDIMSVVNGTRAHFRGGDGNDTMTGADQDDALRGAAGEDILNGGDGTDTVQYDRRSGSAPFTHGAFVNLSVASATMMFNGFDITVAAAHAYDNWGDTDSLSNIENVRGSDFDDIVLGSDVGNFIDMAGGADTVWAGAGDDEVLGGDGNDEIHGESGENDILQGYAGDDIIDGGLGTADATDYYDDPNGVTVNLATGIAKDGYGGTDVLQDIEQIYASFYDDLLTGDSQDNWFEARDGDDIVFGGAGNDSLIGGNGDDELHGEDDSDTLEGGAGNDLLDGGQGNDFLYGGENDDTLLGGAGNDELYGEDNDDTLEGGAGDDTIFGGEGIDTLSYEHSPLGVYVNPNVSEASDGHGGTDLIGGDIENYRGSDWNDQLYGIEGGGPSASNVIEGGAGDDYINGDENTNYDGDMVSYLHDPAGVTVDLSAGTATDGYGDEDEIVNIEGILGSAYDDTLTGTGVGNRIEAGSGYDTINMPTLQDTYIDGGRGQDILALNDAFATIDLTAPDFVLTGVETIDLTGTGSNFLVLSGANVADISDDSNLEFDSDFADNLVIKGDSGDQVTLVSDSVVGWTPGATNVTLDGSGPGTYNIYNYTEGSVTASLAVDHDVAVVIAPV